MKFRRSNNIDEKYIVELFDSNIKDIDKEKYLVFREELQKGIGNYSFFQKFSDFKWPSWIESITNLDSPFYSQIIPPILNNNNLREWNSFSNFLSNDELFIDPSGMLSPSYDKWSVEIWIFSGGSLYRPQDRIEKVNQERDPDTSVMRSVWKEKPFNFTQTIFGARSSIDEAIIEVKCNIKNRDPSTAMLFVIRPYNHIHLGGISSINYHKDQSLLSINGKKTIAIIDEPNFLLSGNGKDGDIDINDKDNPVNSNCSESMATYAVGYSLSKGDNKFHFRLSLNRDIEIAQGDVSFKKLKEEYISYSKIRITNGMNLKIPDKMLQNWFYASKISVLNFLKREIFNKVDQDLDCKSIFYITFGYNRMGYSSESLELINLALETFVIDKKNVTFNDIVKGCYILNCVADYFIHTRDVDFLKLKYGKLKDIAAILYKNSSGIKNINSNIRNSIDNYFIKTGHYFDIILLSFSFSQFSYLSRCLGIFGDEKKFGKESERLTDIFIKNDLEVELNENRNINEFFYYSIYSGFPFRLNGITDKHLNIIIDRIYNNFLDVPIRVKSLGWDIVSSLVIGNTLIYLKDKRANDIIYKLMKTGDKSFILSDYLNPIIHKGIFGNGISKVASSLFFSFIRNMMFLDTSDSLDIFPVPQEEWFKPGSEIIIDNSPSRFGNIYIRVVGTTNEIQFHFEKLPKYVPPEIIINLPVKTKIINEDDFIVKKKKGDSYFINGWPTVIRFMRK